MLCGITSHAPKEFDVDVVKANRHDALQLDGVSEDDPVAADGNERAGRHEDLPRAGWTGGGGERDGQRLLLDDRGRYGAQRRNERVVRSWLDQ